MLEYAYLCCKANGGAAGVDNRRFEAGVPSDRSSSLGWGTHSWYNFMRSET